MKKQNQKPVDPEADVVDVGRLLDELKEGDGYGDATWAEYERQLPVLVADKDAEKAKRGVVELKTGWNGR